MTEQERAVLSAAVDVADWQDAIDCGNDAEVKRKEAYERLLRVVGDLHAAHDGRWRGWLPD